MLSEKPWKLHRTIYALLAVLVFFCFFNLVAAIALHYLGKEKFDEGSLLYLILITLTIHGAILLGTLVALKSLRLRVGEAFGFSSPGKIQALFLGAFAGILFQPLSWVLQMAAMFALKLFGHESPQQDAMVSLQKAQSIDSRIYFVVFSVLIAPAAEEILFRGIIYPTIKQLGYPRTALWVTALAFAAIHRNLPIFGALVIMSIILTWLYERTDNLLAPITAHGIFNSITVIIVYIQEHRFLQAQ